MAAKNPRPDDVTRFLNVDLDIEGPHDLSPLVTALAPRVFDLHTGPARKGYQTHLELDSRGGEPRSAEAAIQGFVELLAGLPAAPRRLWKAARTRDFNIGIQAGSKPHAFEVALSEKTLQAVARLGARVVVTVYAPDTSTLHRRPRRRRL